MGSIDKHQTLNRTARESAHALAIGAARNLKEAAIAAGIAPATLYRYLTQSTIIRQAFEAEIVEVRERRADRASRLAERAERLAERAMATAERQSLDPVTGMQVAALGVKVSSDLRSVAGDTPTDTDDTIDRYASRLRRTVIHALSYGIRSPHRASALIEVLQRIEVRRVFGR